MAQGRGLALVLRDLLPPAGLRVLLPVQTLIELAALADRLGYHSIWIPEGRGRELFTTLGAMGRATDRLRLASGILTIYSRPPALAAMAAATLADLTGGRFMLGLGVGHPDVIEAGYGVPYRRPLAAMREYVDIVRRILDGTKVAFYGKVFRVTDFQLESRPSHPVPICLAALGEGMLRLAGEIGDGVVLNWMPPERVRWAAQIVRDAAADAGRDPASVTVVCYVRAAVADDPRAAWTVMRRLLAAYIEMPAYARMFRDAGFAAEVSAIRGAWAASGVGAAAATVPQDFIERLAVVGPAEACRAGLSHYLHAGADVVVAYPFPVGADGASSLRVTIEALATARPSL
ncbi:MAG: LLM class flavin-dependent oxidoreductase [Armatimonadota bacterium]